MLQVRPVVTQVTRRAEEVRTPGPRLSGVRRLVIVRDDRVGDLALSVPAVDALRRTYPAARLALLVAPRAAALAGMIDGVDRVLVAGHGRDSPLHLLRAFRPDLAVCVSRSAAIAWAVARARVRHRVGPGLRLYSPLFGRRVAERRSAGERHELEYALSFAHRAGAPPGPARFPLRVPAAAEREVAAWCERSGIERRGLVLLHPGSGGSCPVWPAESFLGLARALRGDGHAVAFSVGPADARVAAALDRSAADTRDLPRFTGGLVELAALCRRAALVASNSTGPLHVAAALGTATLGFYPPWPTCGVGRWGPYADNGWALVTHDPQAARWGPRRRRRRGPALMQALPVELAAGCARRLLAGQPPLVPATA